MVIVLESSIYVCPDKLSCITGLDVLENIFIYDVTDGWACVQKDPIWVNDVGGWFILRGLGHGESHM